jgi:hypothetical protein
VTAQEKTLERLAGHIEGDAFAIPTKETIYMTHRSNEARNTASTSATPEMLAYIEAHPDWENEPVVDIMRAGFSSQEFGVFAALSLAAHRTASPETLESPAAMRDAAEKLLCAASRREAEDAIANGQRVVDVKNPDGKPGAAVHLVHQQMTGNAYSFIINLPVGGPWKTEIAEAVPGSTFGSADCTFTYIGLFDYVREWQDDEGGRFGRFVERAASPEANAWDRCSGQRATRNDLPAGVARDE